MNEGLPDLKGVEVLILEEIARMLGGLKITGKPWIMPGKC
jgi:hypothetical protein